MKFHTSADGKILFHIYLGKEETVIKIPDSVEIIFADIFEKGCEGVEKIFFPKNFHYITKGVYRGCKGKCLPLHSGVFIDILYPDERGLKSLKTIEVDKENPYYSSYDGVLYNKTGTRLKFYPPNKDGESFEVPSTVRRIDFEAFFNTQLREIVLPNNFCKFDNSAIVCNRFLEKVAIPKSCKRMGLGNFCECPNLKLSSDK